MKNYYYTARRRYAEPFPHPGLPNEKTFNRLHNRLREAGSFKQAVKNRDRLRTTRTLGLKERWIVLRKMQVTALEELH